MIPNCYLIIFEFHMELQAFPRPNTGAIASIPYTKIHLSRIKTRSPAEPFAHSPISWSKERKSTPEGQAQQTPVTNYPRFHCDKRLPNTEQARPVKPAKDKSKGS